MNAEPSVSAVYHGYRIDGELRVSRHRLIQAPKNSEIVSGPLEPRLDLANHSPTGFECGYGGSGPAQLALAILADFLADDEEALRLHQAFKWKITANLPLGAWTLTSIDIEEALRRLAKTTSPGRGKPGES